MMLCSVLQGQACNWRERQCHGLAALHTSILVNGPLQVATRALEDLWTLQQNNSSTHTASCTQNWLGANNMIVLLWLTLSPDINIMKNEWGELVRMVLKDEKIYGNFPKLGDAIVENWLKIDVSSSKTFMTPLPHVAFLLLREKVQQ